ncbi:MAG: hypothetical protein EAZ92_08425 [Candidatus Kapaibacterium sp.]|nr:MAG: hypothetical protein EAZ92_08425 [Candidatus Kapabacteria bacterium]
MATLHSSSKSLAQQTKDAVPITIRLMPEEKAAFRKLAQAKGLSYRRLLMELVHTAQGTDAQPHSGVPRPSELYKLSRQERDSILQKQSIAAASLYAQHPELIADGSDDVIEY